MSTTVQAIPQSISPNPSSSATPKYPNGASATTHSDVRVTRQTTTNSFSNAMKNGLLGAGQVALNVVGTATGTPQITNALSGIAGNIATNGQTTSGLTAGASTDSTTASIIQSQKQNTIDQLNLIELQSNIQNENRQISMISNISKAKHDTAKAAITNIRV